jgi:carboxyl-terminal processing protease
VKITWVKKSFWMFYGAILGATIVVGTSVWAESENEKKASPDASPQAVLPLEELRSFVEVFDRISTDYVEPVENKELLEGAISGMLSSLDPHSAYLPPKNYKKMEEHTTGEFGGLGMEVGMEDGFVKVISPIDDTPAQKAGVKAGDLIIKLDDHPVKGKSLADAVKIMRGKPGSKITLTIVRQGEDKPIVKELTRAIIKVKSVKEQLLNDGMGYVRISQFQMRTGEDLVKTIEKLEKENKGPLNGLVLDLRNNPGGVLRAAVEVSDAFLNDGLIVYTKGRVKNSEMNFEAEAGDLMEGKPIVVLINEGSASASEIVSGALQDQKRALIAGRTSFGKGSVQTLIPLNNGGAIKVTTARYYTPSGRSIQAEGIKPDIEIDQVKVEKLQAPDFTRIKEKDLSGHLDGENEDEESTKKLTKEQKASQKALEELLANDYELHEALSLLKGMYFTQQMKQ